MSAKLAILKFCRECIVDPGWDVPEAQQIAGCTAKACPLFAHRPSASELAADGKVRALRVGQKSTVKRTVRAPRA